MKDLDRMTHPGSHPLLRYGAELRNFVLHRVSRILDADDVVQEVFLRLLRMPDTDFLKNPRAYICGVALHVVREFKMRDLKAGTWATVDPAEIVDLAERPAAVRPDDLPAQVDIQQRIERALLRIPAAHRAVFVLHNRDGYSYEEIAAKLGISVHTVDKYLLQAKVKFRAMEWDR